MVPLFSHNAMTVTISSCCKCLYFSEILPLNF